MVILGVSFDSVADNRAFAEKYQYPFALLTDADRKTALAYGAVETAQDQYPRRNTYVISADGRLEQIIATKNPAAQAADLLPGL